MSVRGFAMLLAFVAFLRSDVSALLVPNAECTCSQSATAPGGCWISSATCHRTDSSPYVVAAGTPDVVYGSTLTCTNCNGCPNCPPPEMNCTQELSASFTEEVSASVASGIQAGIPGLEATLESSIGHSAGRTLSDSVTCGSSSFPPCKKGVYKAKINTKTNIQTRIDHSYQWFVQFELNGGGNCTPPNTFVTCTTTRSSNADGDAYDGGVECEWGGYLTCP